MRSKEEAAKLHIEELRSKKFFIGRKELNPLNKDLHHAVTGLSAELYAKDAHFIMELIQNAEDNQYVEVETPTLEFLLTEKDIASCNAPATLLIFNNEVGFSRQNMDSLCSVGLSTKKGKRILGFIGEKGIGFKSVFVVSSRPHIFSNGYRVRFSEEPDRDCGIGYIVPEWVEGKPYVSDIQNLYGLKNSLPTTVIILPLKPDKVEAVKAQLADLHPELLLFLSKIKLLYVRDGNGYPKNAEDVSIVSMSSASNHVELRDKRADSCMVQLSVKGKMSVAEQTCGYYIWRQAFPVKSENRVNARMGVEDWIIMLAFPCGKRLGRGISSIGVFAFLPTAMVTNFPFIIQADFMVASSRESILLDNKWNLGILECVPSAFVNAFNSSINDSLFSVSQPFEFLPVEASPIFELNSLRETIRKMLQNSNIIPCSTFHGLYGKTLIRRPPSGVVRIYPEFQVLLDKFKSLGFSLEGLSLLDKCVLHSLMDHIRFNAVLDFLGVLPANNSYYASCIADCNLALLASDEDHIGLLCFVADLKGESFKHIPLLKYINGEGKVILCTLNNTKTKVHKLLYALDPRQHDWQNKCNMEFGCPDNMFFLPNSTERALICHNRSTFLRDWLFRYAGVTVCSVNSYADSLIKFVRTQGDAKFTVKMAQFLYHSHNKHLIHDGDLNDICKRLPIVDGSNKVRMHRTTTLVPASGSRWAKLLGFQNPFIAYKFADLGNVYGRSSSFAGVSTPKKELLVFLSKHCGAVDLKRLNPPNMPLQVASTELTCLQAFLLLNWIRSIRARVSILPKHFINSVRNGKWLKTYSGFYPPCRSILPDATGQVIFDMMKNLIGDFTIIDQKFYMNEIGLFTNELKFLGVACGLQDVQNLAINCCRCCASSGMSKERALSLLMFLRYLKASNMLDDEWLRAMKEGKWLKTTQGYSTPSSSILLRTEVQATAVLTITNVPVIDEEFYENQISSFSSELLLLGVELDMERVYSLIAENILYPLNLASMHRDGGLLILNCIRHSKSASGAWVEEIRNQKWLKTSVGAKCPKECILSDPAWNYVFNGIEMPIIDEAFYGDEIRTFKNELKAIGVATEFDDTANIVIGEIKSRGLTSSLTASDVYSILNGIRWSNKTLSSYAGNLHNCLSGVCWLKTRHGYKTSGESILSNSKWGTVSLFVDLPLVDDSFYGIDIYVYKDELKFLGVITDFERGVAFVARGLTQPIEPHLVTDMGTITMLDSIKLMMCSSDSQSLPANFINNLRKSKWLRTYHGYKVPEECILLDEAWDDIVLQTDLPIIDQKFYETDISCYKDQLRFIGVKVDPGDVCSLLASLLSTLVETNVIAGVYSFLNRFKWKPEPTDKSSSVVWIPNQDHANGGNWVNSQLCVLHGNSNLFGSHFLSLDKYYSKELLPFFSRAFGVTKFPSIDDYLQLWESWALRTNQPVSLSECRCFWVHIVENWDSCTEEILRQRLVQVPAVSSLSKDIYLVNREEVFIPDDLLLEKTFSSVNGIALFVWLPKWNSSPFLSPKKLSDIYHSIGVRKISESIKCVTSNLCLDQIKKVASEDVLIVFYFILFLSFAF